ncbi:MAG: arginine--tRNA ligase [Euryarchaeota archaeon]|nr:arginine--tRNA ligase [Euryarchaeota archaeon]
MYRNLEKEAIKSLKHAIESLGYGSAPEIKIEEPPNPDLGDLASAVSFQLSTKLKKSPMEITEKIIEVMQTPDIFRKVETKGPYINFFIDYEKFSKMVLESINDDYGKLETKNKKIIVEHTSANPNGPLHIGHIRNAIIGDSLARILKAAGYGVETQYYVNDMGRQIAMVVWGILNLGYKMDKSQKSDHEIGKIYLKVNQELKINPHHKEEIDDLIRIYEEGDNAEVTEIFESAVQGCLDGVASTAERLNINHDLFVWESRFIKDGSVTEILSSLDDYILENEVLYINLEEYGVEKELVLRRSDGTSLYSTRDIAYHLEKSKNADIIIDVLGSDHKLAIEQLKIVLKLLKATTPDVIFYEFITLPEGSMSTRRGVFISVDELIDDAIDRALVEINKRRSDLDEISGMEIAEKIGIGAIRYYIAKLSPEKHIVFKWDEALSFEMGCASIQYAHARACRLLDKAGFDISKFELSDLNNFNLDHPFEIDLLKTLSKFTSIIEESAKIKRVHPIAQYAQELANAFNKFYKSVPVVGSDKEGLRLLLVDRSRIVIRNCLDLLGIEAPISM